MKKYIVAFFALISFWASLYLFFGKEKIWAAITCFFIFIVLFTLFEKLRKKDEQKRIEEDSE
jgi:membrane associated rhomboid family serine protease